MNCEGRSTQLLAMGARVNIWLAVFNLIPFGPLDGAKILRWNKGIWLLAIAGAGGLFVAERFFF
jgi:Zn-dependent protease